jgi:hypothetical protein
LDLQTNGTTAISISASQVVTFANQPAYTGGTANGVLYLNASKVVTSGSALSFNGTTLTLGGNGGFESAFSGNGLIVSKTNVGAVNAIRSVSNTSDVLLINDSASGFANTAFYSSGSEGMRLTSTGLGIGTTSPSSKLHLSSSASTAQIITSVGTNVYSSVSFLNTTTGYGYDVGFGGSASVAPNSFYVYGGSSASVKMVIDPSGNFGIGTTSPSVKLQVNGASNASALRLNETTSNRNTYLGFIDVSGNFGIDVNDGGYLRFAVNGAERARIDTSGRIGFGSQGTSSDRLFGASFAGATTSGSTQFGIVFNPTYPNTATVNLFNVYSGPNLTAGTTVTNVFGYYLEAINAAGSTVTNRYGIYQAGASDNNVFAGNVTVNNGITFPATQVASANANTLDDYEEGTWTPTVIGDGGGSLTLNSYTATYTKIGNIVNVFWQEINWTANTLSGLVRVGGLPFAARTNFRSSTGGFGGSSPGSMTFTGQLVPAMDGGATSIFFINKEPTNNTYSHTPTFASSGVIYGLSFTYLTAN